MGERLRALRLLAQAADLFDAPTHQLASSGRTAWRMGFASGGQWMREALELLRSQPVVGPAVDLNRLGIFKYALASSAALAWLVVAMCWRQPLLIMCSVLMFYLVEAQMVFLFPLALDGSTHPFRDARRWTRQAGGTLAVLRVVLPVAAMMLLGGLLGRGFVRSWCIGCLAVCIWYEHLRRLPCPNAADAAELSRP
jgi:hypothetical protein